MSALSRFLRRREGATAMEYAMIAAFIAIILVTSITVMGTATKRPFDDIRVPFEGGAGEGEGD